MKKTIQLIVLAIFFCSGNLVFGQVPANDNCATAQNLGTLPAPSACPSGTGAAVTAAGTNINATAPNPYTTLLGCQTGGNQPGPALDVWYRFVASGNQVNINVTPGAAPFLANPAVTLWTGACGSLVGYNCSNNGTAGGNNTVLFQPTTPGTTYYIQISGMNATAAGNFNLSVSAANDCNNCLQNANLVVTPLPVNGTYPPNTAVKFCYNITSYAQVSSNWLHGVIPTFGCGWDLASITTTAAAALTPLTGTWKWFPGGNTSTATGSVTGPGFYFDYNTAPGNAGNNFGDNCATTPTCNWSFCWTIKTLPNCSGCTNLNVSINTTGDGETGSWSSVACTGDPNYNFAAIMSCCSASATASTLSCFGGSNATATVTATGSAPITYTWSTVPAQNTSTAGGLTAGTYTATIKDNNSCVATATVLVTQPTSVTATPSFTNATCTVLGSAAVTAGGGTPGYTYSWSPSGGTGATATGLNPGTYSVTVTDSKLCTRTATVAVAQTGTVSAAFSTPTATQCLTGNSFVFTAGTLIGTHTYSFNPTVGAPATGNVATYGPVSFTAPGTYTVTHTITSGVCSSTATSIVVINPQPTVTANNNSPSCVGGSVIFSSTGGGTYSWSGPAGFISAAQNPTLTPIALTNAGVYTVTVNLSGCTGTATTNVSISNPTTSATNTGSYCAGATIQLNASAATSYSWSGPGGFISNLQNPTIVNSTTAMSGTYNLTVSLGVCTATATTTVVVNALPTPNATNTGPYCPGATIQLNVGAFTTYTWSGPGAFSSNVQNPTISTAAITNGGVYTVTVANASGCLNTSTTTVVVNPTPTVTANNNSPSCVGGSVTFSSTGGGSYSWSGPAGFISAVQNPTLSPIGLANAGVYTVTVTLSGCANTATTSVSISNPTTSASNTGPFCAGTTIQLNVPAATSYTWSGPGGFTSNAQNPTIANATTAMAGIYTVSVSLGVCSASATTTVVVNALPTPTAGNTGPYCPGNTIQLNVGAFTTYTWSGPSAFSSNAQNPTQTNATTTNGGTYSVVVKDANGCVNTSTTNVVVNPTPVVVIGSNSPVCINTAINLTSNGGTGYAWSGPNGFTSANQNPSVTSASTLDAGVYTVTVTALGCTNTGSVNVSVLSPTTSASNTGAYCAGTTIQLNTPAATTYNWSGPLGFTSALQNPTLPASTTGMTGVYSLTVSVGSCTAAATTSVTVNALPTPTATNTGPYCSGATILLNVGAFNTYTWTGPSFSSNVQNPSITSSLASNSGLYSVSVTDANGCTNTSNSNVIVNTTPTAAAVGATVCENSNANLTASGGSSYAWAGPGGFVSLSQNPSIPNAAITASGQYTVVVMAVGSCSDIAFADVLVNPNPIANATSNGPVCINTMLNLTGSGGATYSWNGPNGFSSNLQNPSFNANSTAFTGNYNLSVVDANGCSSSTVIPVVINGIPSGAISSSGNVGCAPLCVTFTINGSASITNYNWNFGNGITGNTANPQTCFGSTGVYTINAVVSDAAGCTGTATYTVQVYPQPVADFNHAPIKPIINQDPLVTFTDASHGTPIVSWNWYFMNTAQYTSNVQNPTFAYTEPGTYAVALVVKSDKGCTDTIVRPLVVGEDFGMYVPNTFTPNDDGLNDKFQPKGFGVVKYNLKIFDRWGEKIFETSTFEEAWDGTYHGRGSKICEQASYTWLIEVTDVFGKAHELKGHVTLIK